VLEDPSCPSSTLKLVGTTLAVTGDASNDDVRPTAHGSLVSVTCDQGQTVTADGILQIVVDLDGGADHFTMLRAVPTGPSFAAAAPLLLRLSTGGGDDVVNFDGAPGSQDSIWVDLNRGDDRFQARFIPPPDPDVPIPPLGQVPANSSVFLNVHGGPGSDLITSRMGVEPTPFTPSAAFPVTADGGAGSDLGVFPPGVRFVRVERLG
jgi:hypothetical protein